MKNKLYIVLFVLMTESAIAQINGDWYASVVRINRAESQIKIQINKGNKGYAAAIDFINENKPGIRPDRSQIDSLSVFIILSDRKIAVDVRYNEAKDELSGEIVFSGKPRPVVFTRKRPAPTTVEPIKGGNTGEGGDASLSPDINSKRRVEKFNSVFIEELTWVDVRDALREGYNTVLIGTGGTEQSGPYVVMGKHNYILRVVTDSIARRLGNALVAPIVPFVPEGNFDPPTQHLKYPGSISLREETYELLLKDIATSYKVEGFTNIVFLGDSGGNQWGMYVVAKELNDLWKDKGVRVIYIHEYYDNTRISTWLESQGIKEGNEGIHDNFKVTAQLSVLNPELVRTSARIKAGNYFINGINLSPPEKTIEWGKMIASYQTTITVDAIQKELKLTE
jgi:creatinine amidohydrolase